MNAFGLGLPEMLVCAGGFLCIAISVAALGGGLWLSRRNSPGGDEAALRREVARLQAEVDRLKRDTP
jgi:hypothetical protein